MVYNPNFNDPRVMTRVQQAYGFSLAIMSPTKSHQWSTRFIDKHFGVSSNSLSKYLREVLLVTTNNHWSIEQHKCKEYILNSVGVDYLRGIIQGTIDITWNQYKNNNLSNEVNCVDLLCDKARKLALSEAVLQQNKKVQSNSLSIPYCITSFEETDKTKKVQSNSLSIPYCITSFEETDKTKKWDYKMVNQWCKREFGSELTTLVFDYEDKSNRLWHPLQSVKKEYKNPLLAESGLKYQYDIQCAAPTLIHQYAQTLDMDLWLETLRDYIANKTQIRHDLAAAAEVPIKTVKVLINALLCGAKLGNNPEFALSHLLDYDRARIEFFRTNQFIIDIRADIKTCWHYIESKVTTTYITLENGTKRKKPMSSKNKWGVYFNLERTVLNLVRQYLTNTNNPHFLEHDGWSTANPINQQELLAYIKETTGYTIALDFTKYN
jgi:hypothetical protein